ncbi:peptidoglycan L-alanyl-D-glutamate endopeptidase CwlK [Lentibacillus halodurans]|uniref:Peptidoglycan L-alanyl-D-glutamate endopeptidase CwlK n=1 Tax=Lentibacillus halodurans TaxID=237679 RepID=A0A1I0XYA3_9BACI|nr:M15 family metallopeptidase [Lentibacillus halodurans]SFB04953.1 peptidoglycan L-alanyl-D-glutamate endopeptidase CwlK [Lentibacillus halodurans]
MKHYRKDIIAWIIIILFLVMLFFLYNQLKTDRYIDQGGDLPLPENLDPIVAAETEELVEQAAERNIEVVITETVRTIQEQNNLYEQGRSEDGSIVTYAKGGESYHNYGMAVDYALRNHNGDIIWDTSYDGNNNGESDWFEVADMAKELGFEWGGDWNHFKDYPHLQMDFGLSIEQLKQGLRPKHDEESDE